MKVFLLNLLILVVLGTGMANAQPNHFGPPGPPADCDIYYEDTPGVVLANSSKNDVIFAFSRQFSFKLSPRTSVNLQEEDIPFGFYSLMVSGPGTGNTLLRNEQIELRPGLTIVCH